MATAYVSDWIPPYFKEIGFREDVDDGPDSKFMKNGKLAMASTCNDIASNQQWLALKDTDGINFIHQVSASKTVNARILLNPFCEYIELYFLVFKSFSGSFATDPAYIQVACSATSETRTYNMMAGGETTSKPSDSNIPDCQWVVFKDINANLTSNDPGALRVRSTNIEKWAGVEFTVTTSSSVVIYSGYYRVVKPKTGLVVST